MVRMHFDWSIRVCHKTRFSHVVFDQEERTTLQIPTKHIERKLVELCKRLKMMVVEKDMESFDLERCKERLLFNGSWNKNVEPFIGHFGFI